MKKIQTSIKRFFSEKNLYRFYGAALLPSNPGGLPGDASWGASTLVGWIINIILGIVGLLAVFFLILGGFRYITSAGNEQAAENAKKMITNAIIGIVIVLLSYAVVIVVMRALISNVV